MDESEYQMRITALEKENRILKQKIARSEANRAILEELLETHSIALKTRHAELEESQELIQQSEAKYRSLALHDTLTGLPNRIMFQERLTKAIFYAQKSGTYVALLYIDLDQFKPVNDTWGHQAGDTVLQKIAGRLQDCVRGTDMLARIGGDEFAAIMENLGEFKNTRLLAERILKKIAKPIPFGEQSWVLGASIGISCYPMDGNDMNSLMQNADAAMYTVKKNSRNGYLFYQDLVENVLS